MSKEVGDVTIVLLLGELDSIARYIKGWMQNDMRQGIIQIGDFTYPSVTVRRAWARFLPAEGKFDLAVRRPGYFEVIIPNQNVVQVDCRGYTKVNPRFCTWCGAMTRRNQVGEWFCPKEHKRLSERELEALEHAEWEYQRRRMEAERELNQLDGDILRHEGELLDHGEEEY